MKRRGARVILSLWMAAGVVIAAMSVQAVGATGSEPGLALAQQRGSWPGPRLTERSGHASLMFIEDVGQFGAISAPRFQVLGGPSGIVWLADQAVWITLLERLSPASRGCGLGEEGGATLRRGVNVRLTFVGANAQPQIVPLARQHTKLSYFRGSDPGCWHSAVPVWGGVRYEDLYPGVDLVVGTGIGPPSTASGDSPLPWRLVVHPEAAPDTLRAVRLRVEGVRELRLDAEGRIEMATDAGLIRQALPAVEVAEPVNSWRETWGLGQPTISGTDILLPYGSDPAIRMDPGRESSPGGLAYSTFLGGAGSDQGCALAVDPEDGSVVVSGVADSFDFPTLPGAFDVDPNGDYDAFVARLRADGGALLHGTFLGGASGDGSRAVAVDPRDGTIVVSGATASPDFPTTAGAFDPTHNGGYDAFAARLSTDGSALLYSTFLGGSDADKGWGMALHPSDGTATIVGRTRSSDFPTTAGAFDLTHNGSWDAFSVQLREDGSALSYASYLGGSGVDYGEAVAVDPADGTAVIAGGSFSSDFPTTPGAFDATHNGLGDAVVVRLEKDGSRLLFSTFVGGSHHDESHSVAVDPADGSAVITGGAMSPDFPTTPEAFDSTFNGGQYDAYVARLSPDGSSLLASTFLGGEGDDYGAVVSVDPGSGKATVTGPTTSVDYPTSSGALAPVYGGGASDTFVAQLNVECSELLYSTFLGGELAEWSWGLAAAAEAPAESVIVTGHTWSPDFPTTSGAFEPLYSGGGDAFVARLATALPTAHVHAISVWGRTPGAYHVVLSLVRIVDQDSVPVGGAMIEATVTKPGGSTASKSATTNADGRALFWAMGETDGIWTTCVQDVTASGYVYDPTQNEESCDSIVYP